MSTTIVVTVLVADSRDITRDSDGTPSLASRTQHAQLYLATASDDGGWLLETWHEDGDDPRQQIDLIPDTESLAAGVADAVRAIAEIKE